MDRSVWNATWFGRVVWLGILVNLSFAIPALFFPAVFSSWLGLGPVLPDIWLRNTGMLLALLCPFYALAARDPFYTPVFAWFTNWARFLAALFWLVLLCFGYS